MIGLVEAFCEDVIMGFKDFGVKFLWQLILFPFILITFIILTAAYEVIHDRCN